MFCPRLYSLIIAKGKIIGTEFAFCFSSDLGEVRMKS